MPIRHVSVPAASAEQVPEPIRQGMTALRDSLGVPADFAPEVSAAAAADVARGPLDSAPNADELGITARVDHTDLPFVTIDPIGSMDLDQAMFIESRDDENGKGFRVWYAIADVAAWVHPGQAVDQEAHRRGQTFYAPLERAPLHPSVLSEAAASLLADGTDRPALVWQIDLDESGAQVAAKVERSTVRSRERLDYIGVQKMLDEGNAPEWLLLLKQVGQLRERQEITRGGVSLNLPEQEIVTDGAAWHVEYRSPLPVEGWNAQISLLTGMAAATMMLQGKVGLLRTLPPAEDRAVGKLRATARSLGIAWPKTMNYPDFVRSLDVSKPSHLAMMTSCTSLFRGAAYTLIDATTVDTNLKHNALAANYAHCTAPLRRLVDRFVGEICVHLCAGTPVPQWVLDALPALPQQMADSDKRAKKFERGVTDLVEALVLSSRIGETFSATVIDSDGKGHGAISIADPATEAKVTADGLELGQEVHVKLLAVDLVKGSASFDVLGDAPSA